MAQGQPHNTAGKSLWPFPLDTINWLLLCHAHIWSHSADTHTAIIGTKMDATQHFSAGNDTLKGGRRRVIGSNFLKIIFLFYHCQFLDPSLRQCVSASIQLRPASMQKSFVSWRSTKLASAKSFYGCTWVLCWPQGTPMESEWEQNDAMASSTASLSAHTPQPP